MAVTLLGRAAARAPAPVFAAVGGGARSRVQDLSLRPGLTLVASPRHATVLLVAGWVPATLLDPLARVHDQLPAPRATVWWGVGAGFPDPVTPDPVTVAPGGDVAGAVVACHRDLVTGRRPSEGHLLPDEPPHPWRGVGPYGQGGEGMMGGTPYGRPMPMAGDDRDGLALDQLRLRVGPFFPPFPPGLALDVVLQGDVVRQATPAPNPFAGAGAGITDDPFARALSGPVPLADLEVARAGHHLRWLSAFLALHGLPALAARALRLAAAASPRHRGAVRALGRLLERARSLRGATDGVGVVSGDALAGWGGGPVVRAAGRPEDARAGHPAYAALGFAPLTHPGGDAAARWRQRLAEAIQALELAAGAGPATVGSPGPVEGPRGSLGAGDTPGRLERLPGLLEGLAWDAAVTTVASLDLDLEPTAVPDPAGRPR